MLKLMIVLLLAVPVLADELPAKVESITKPAGRVHYANKEYWLYVAALGTAWTMDTVSTHDVFSRYQNVHEGGVFFTGTRDTPKIMGAYALFDFGCAVGSYEMKRHIHNRYLHPLWRLPMLWQTGQHLDGSISNWQLKPTSITVGVKQ